MNLNMNLNLKIEVSANPELLEILKEIQGFKNFLILKKIQKNSEEIQEEKQQQSIWTKREEPEEEAEISINNSAFFSELLPEKKIPSVNFGRYVKNPEKKETRGRYIKYSPEDLQNYENKLYGYIKEHEPCPVPYQQPSLSGGLCDIYSDLLKTFGKGYIIDICLKSLAKKGLILKEKIDNASGKSFVYKTVRKAELTPEIEEAINYIRDFPNELLETEEAQKLLNSPKDKIEKVYPPAAQETIERNFEEEEREEGVSEYPITCHKCNEKFYNIVDYSAHSKEHFIEAQDKIEQQEEKRKQTARELMNFFWEDAKKKIKEEQELNSDIIQGIERRKPTSKYQCPECKNPSIIKTNEAVDDYLSPTIEETDNREVWKCMACSRMYYTEQEVLRKEVEKIENV